MFGRSVTRFVLRSKYLQLGSTVTSTCKYASDQPFATLSSFLFRDFGLPAYRIHSTSILQSFRCSSGFRGLHIQEKSPKIDETANEDCISEESPKVDKRVNENYISEESAKIDKRANEDCILEESPKVDKRVNEDCISEESAKIDKRANEDCILEKSPKIDERTNEECIIRLFGFQRSVTVDDVLKFLDGVEVLNGKDGIHIIQDLRRKTPSGVVYVELAGQENLEPAKKKHKQYIGERFIHVSGSSRLSLENAVNKPQQKNKEKSSLTDQSSQNDEYIIRLWCPQTLSVDDIFKFLDGVEVLNGKDGVHITRNATFIELADEENLELAIRKDKGVFGDQHINVRRAARTSLEKRVQMGHQTTEEGSPDMVESSHKNYIVKLTGFQSSTSASDIVTFLDGVQILNGNDGVHLVKPFNGIAYVELTSQEDLKAAMLKHCQYIKSRFIKVVRVNKARMKHDLERPQPYPIGHSYQMGEKGTNDDCVIRLNDLPWEVSVDNIVEFFDGVEILNGKNGVHVIYSKGRTTGAAYIEVADQNNMKLAMRKQKKYLGGRSIKVYSSNRSIMETVLECYRLQAVDAA